MTENVHHAQNIFEHARVVANSLFAQVHQQPRSQGLFPGLWAGREKALASAGHVSILHPEILGVIN